MKEYNLKNLKQEFKEKGIFYTQPELALYMKSLIDRPIHDVYDPTCGAGNLLAVFDDDLPKFGQELNDHQLEVANQYLGNFTGVCGDTLKDPAFMDRKFSCIMANPPFSVKWEPPVTGMFGDERFAGVPVLPPKSKADYAFLLHIIHMLADDGIAIVLNSGGIGYRGNSEGRIRQYIIENNWIDKVIHIGGNKFVDTKIATLCLVLKKDKKNTDIEFIDDEQKISRIVTLDEVREKGFTLSVNQYIDKKREEEEIDPRIFESPSVITKRILRGQIEYTKNLIELRQMLGDKDTETFDEYLDKVEELIKEFRNKN